VQQRADQLHRITAPGLHWPVAHPPRHLAHPQRGPALTVPTGHGNRFALHELQLTDPVLHSHRSKTACPEHRKKSRFLGCWQVSFGHPEMKSCSHQWATDYSDNPCNFPRVTVATPAHTAIISMDTGKALLNTKKSEMKNTSFRGKCFWPPFLPPPCFSHSSASSLPPILKHPSSKLRLERRHLNKQRLLPSKTSPKPLTSRSKCLVLR